MAMLAEPRRKQKFSVDPRGSTWSNDDSKFGQKLMEKMGWSKGKGLGINEDGNTEHVAVKVKNDTRGVGCSKNHADNWIAHQDDFNSLLADLNQNHSNSDNAQESKVISLEEKSKTSKGRLHYQKFTKGKDLSLKSEVDLNCVFGKRNASSSCNTPQSSSEPSSDSEDKSHGIQTVTSTDSVQEYFKKKMAEKLGKLTGKNVKGGERLEKHEELDESIETANDLGENGDTGLEDGIVIDFNKNECDLEVIEAKKKRKKKEKKRKYEKEENETVREENVEEVQDVKDARKKKKRKLQKDEEVNEDIGDDSEECIDDLVKKKRKKRKKSDRDDESSIGGKNDLIDNEVHVQTGDDVSANFGETLQTTSTTEEGQNVRKKDKKKSKKRNQNRVDFERTVFPGANLHQLRGYYGLSQNVVQEGLKAKQKKGKM